jgi:hypothetical protein
MRVNLNVPFRDKDHAKRLGARWDPARRVWYVQDVENIAKFMRWMPPHLRRAHGKPFKKKTEIAAVKLNESANQHLRAIAEGD